MWSRFAAAATRVARTRAAPVLAAASATVGFSSYAFAHGAGPFDDDVPADYVDRLAWRKRALMRGVLAKSEALEGAIGDGGAGGDGAAGITSVHIVADSISIDYGPFLQGVLGAAFQVTRKAPGGSDGVTLPRVTGAGRVARDSHAYGATGPGGANGGDSRHVLAYLHALVAARQRADARAAADADGLAAPAPPIDVLLLNAGLHDIKVPLGACVNCHKNAVPLAEYKANVRAALALARLPARDGGLGAGRVVWVRSVPIPRWHNDLQRGFQRFAQDLAAYNAAADEACAEAGVQVVDLTAFSAGLGPAAVRDHVHYTAKASAAQARFIAAALQQQ